MTRCFSESSAQCGIQRAASWTKACAKLVINGTVLNVVYQQVIYTTFRMPNLSHVKSVECQSNDP